MQSESREIWLGFSRYGEKVRLRREQLEAGVVVVGRGAEKLASLVAYDLHRAGEAVFFLDLSGSATEDLSGYIRTLDSNFVINDAFKLEEEDQHYHGQLVSSALSTIFRLGRDQESILNLMVNTSSPDEYASPSAIYGNAPSEGGRVTDKQQVHARLENLRLLEATGELGKVAEIATKSVIINCARAYNEELGEAAAAYILAKLLAAQRKKALPVNLVINDAHRLFNGPRPAEHSKRLQQALLRGSFGKVLATEFNEEIDASLFSESTTRILSSSAWNAAGERDAVLPGVFVKQDIFEGSNTFFLLRDFETRKGDVESGPPPPSAPPSLTLGILDAIQANGSATRESVAAWLSPRFERTRVAPEIERLVNEQFLLAYRSEPRSPLTILKLTVLGEAELKRLRQDGEASDPL